MLDWYAFGLGPNDVLNQMRRRTTRATYVPDIQGSIVASLDAGLRRADQGRLPALRREPDRPPGPSATPARASTRRPSASTASARGCASPTLGRFLRTDPIGTAGRRRSLCLIPDNDPLKPRPTHSRRCPWCVVGAVAGASIEAAMEYHNGALGWTWSSAGRIGLAAATGAIGGGAAGAIGASIVGEGVAAIATRIGLNTIAGAAVSAANTTGSDLIQSGTLPSGGELTSSAIWGGQWRLAEL